MFQRVSKQLDNAASPLRHRIETAETKISAQINSLKANIGLLEESVRDDLRPRRDKVSKSLAELAAIATQSEQIKQQIESIGDHTKAAQEAALQAANVAGLSEKQASSYRDAIFTQLTALYTSTPQESARLNEVRKQIDAQIIVLNDEIMPKVMKLREDISVGIARPPLAGSPEAHWRPDVEAQTQLKPNIRLTEASLSPEQWKQIQQELARMHLYTRKVDGKPGLSSQNFRQMTGTRRAIFKWQGGLRAPQTGNLTSEQIQKLLGSDSTMH